MRGQSKAADDYVKPKPWAQSQTTQDKTVETVGRVEDKAFHTQIHDVGSEKKSVIAQ